MYVVMIEFRGDLILLVWKLLFVVLVLWFCFVGGVLLDCLSYVCGIGFLLFVMLFLFMSGV